MVWKNSKVKVIRDNIETIYQEHLNGKHLATIADEWGIAKATLTNVFKEFNLEVFRYPVHREKIIEDNVVDDMYAMHLQGYSTKKTAEKYGRTAAQVHRAFNRMGYTRRNKPEELRRYYVDHYYFDDVDTQDKAYWLGFIYADGYISSLNGDMKTITLSISQKDEVHILKLLRCLGSDYPVTKHVIQTGYNNCSTYLKISIDSEQMYNALIKLRCNAKLKNVLTPTKLMPNLHRHFLRGYYDGNGSIYTTTNSDVKQKDWYVYFAGTDGLLHWIHDYFVEEGFVKKDYNFEKKKQTHQVGCIRYGGNNQIRRILNHIYEDSTVQLDRKYYSYLKLNTSKN